MSTVNPAEHGLDEDRRQRTDQQVRRQPVVGAGAEGECGSTRDHEHGDAGVDAVTELDGGRTLDLGDEHSLAERPVRAAEAGAGDAHPRPVRDEAHREHRGHEREPPGTADVRRA